MDRQGCAVVSLGTRSACLAPAEPVGVRPDERPEHAAVLVRCAFCGALTPSGAPVTYTTHDDDHYGRTELWYASRHEGTCTGCAAPFDVGLSYCLTRSGAAVELALDPFPGTGAGGVPALVREADLLAAGRGAGTAAPEAGAGPVWLTCLDVATDAGAFAVGRQDGVVLLVDVATGVPRWRHRHHEGRLSGVVLDGPTVWTAGFDGRVVACDRDTGAVLRRLDAGHGRVLGLRPAGPEHLVTVGDDGHARLWDRAGAAVQELDETRFGAAYSVAVTPEWIAIGYQDGHVAVWLPDPASGGWRYDGHLEPAGRRGSPVHAVAAGPAGDLVAFGRDRRVTLHRPGSWQRVAEFEIDVACNDLQFGPSGDDLLGACSDRLVQRWRRPGAGPWNTVGDRFGAGPGGEPWAREMIYSGVRRVGDDGVLATSFDGTAQLFRAADRSAPARVARLGAGEPSGWQVAALP
jgi:hypothetical protein